MSDEHAARYDLHGSAWRGRPHEQHGVLRGPGYLYRAGHILLEDEQPYTGRVREQLRTSGASPHDEHMANFSQAGLPVLAFQVPDEVHIPDLVNQLRQHEDGEPVPNVGPNYVYGGEWDYEGGPEGDLDPARPGEEFTGRKPAAGPPRIAILDTGYDRAVKQLHPGLYDRLDAEGDEDPYTSGDSLAREAGHGTFVAGIIMKLAPDLRIRQVRVLDRSGAGDDATVAHGLAMANAAVVNLSLGGYTHGDQPPVALATALAQLDDSVAVVAAAGNNNSPQPFWPAAFKRVISVGALDTTNGEPVRASFSNYGHWVDIYAPGVRVHSTYLDGTYTEPDKHLAHLKGWGLWNGTSFSTPQVAASIASLVRSGVTARQAAHQVLASARWLPGVGPVLIPQG
jgi:Subtilase family